MPKSSTVDAHPRCIELPAIWSALAGSKVGSGVVCISAAVP